MPTPQRAIVLSQLQLGQAPPGRQLRELLDSIAGGEPVELIVAGGLSGAGLHGPEDLTGLALEGLAALGRTAAPLTLLPGPGEPGLNEPALRQRLQEVLGRTVSFGEELRPGVPGVRRAAGDGSVWVTGGAGLDPTEGLSFDELLGWGELRSFVRAWARQLEMRRQLPPPTGPHQLMAQVLARAVHETAPGREDRALGELLRYLERRGEPDEGVKEVLGRGEVLLREALIRRVRDVVDDAAAAVVVGAATAHEASEEAPTVVLTGSAAGERPTWVEIVLGDALRVQLRGLRPLIPPLRPPAPEAPEPAPEAPPAGPQGSPVPPLSQETPLPPPVGGLGEELSLLATAETEAAEPDIPAEESVEMAVPSEESPTTPAPSGRSRRSRRGKDR